MKYESKVTRTAFIAAALLALIATPASAYVDPPSRVARLSYVSGDVSFQPGGEDDWTWATVNRPLTIGDALWADYDARAELQLGSATIRLDEQSDLSFLNLDDQTLQIQLNAGALYVRLRHLYRDEFVEIDTPNVAVTLLQPGIYRIEADANGDFTSIVVRQGQAQVDGGRRAYFVAAGTEMQASGLSDVDYQFYQLPPRDAFDQWCSQRDRRVDLSRSARYVSREIVGYQDLDTYGNWRVDARLGPIWIPTRVSRDWAPFRDGHWAWIDPWGWTWVDDAPWGFATTHYGRWTFLASSSQWCWVPPQRRQVGGRYTYAVSYTERPFYAPATVSFLGSVRLGGLEIGTSVAWFPLGPGEVYVPAYQASPTYINQVNITNTKVQINVINNSVNNPAPRVVYVNQRVPGAVVAVPSTVFAEARPVAKSVARVSADVAVSAPIVRTAPIKPERAAVFGRGTRLTQAGLAPSAPAAGPAPSAPKPPPVVKTRRVVVKKTPPPPPVSFAQKEQAMAANPGKPIDKQEQQQLRGSAPAAPPVVKAETAAPSKPAEPEKGKPRPAAERRIARRALREQKNAPAPSAPAAQTEQQAAKQAAERERQDQAAQEQADKAREQQSRQDAERTRRDEVAKPEDRQAARDAQEKARQEQQQAGRARDQQAQTQQDAEKTRRDEAAKRQAERQAAEEKARQDQAAQQAERDKQQPERQATEQARRDQAAKQQPERQATEQARRDQAANQQAERQAAEEKARQGQAAQQAERDKQQPERQAQDQARRPGPRLGESASAGQGGRMRVPEAEQAAKLVSQPPLDTSHGKGRVRVRVVIGTDGKVKSATVAGGPRQLHEAALANARGRVYQPTMVDGKPVEVESEISINF